MKPLPDAAVTALGGDRPVIAGAAEFLFNDQWRFWSGTGPLTISGKVYKGIGAAALLVPVASETGGSAEGVKLALSDLDPDVAASIEQEDYHQKPATIWRVVFAADGFTQIGAMVFMRGRVDTAPISEIVGGKSSLVIMVEGPRRDMSRKGARMRSDSDQRILGGAADGGLRRVSTTARKTLAWGNKLQTAAGALSVAPANNSGEIF